MTLAQFARSREDRLIAKVAIFGVCIVAGFVAAGIYYALPRKRRAICIVFCSLGVASLIGAALFANVATNEQRDEYGGVAIGFVGGGVVLGVIGAALYQHLKKAEHASGVPADVTMQGVNHVETTGDDSHRWDDQTLATSLLSQDVETASGLSANGERWLDIVVRSVGGAPREQNSAFVQQGRFPRPSWLTPADLIDQIYKQQEQILRHGSVRWAVIVHANNGAFKPGVADVGAQIVYAPRGDVPLGELKEIAARTFQLKETTPADPKLRRIADMLTNEMERALDWVLPEQLTGGQYVVTSIAMLPRKHMPRAMLALNFFPVLSDPTSLLVQMVRSSFWPPDLRQLWIRNAEVTLQHLRSLPPVQVSKTAIRAIKQMQARHGFYGGYVVIEAGRLDLSDDASPETHVIIKADGLQLAVLREHFETLRGVVIDWRTDSQGSGFTF